MSELQITTNNHNREYLNRWDVPKKVLLDQFDWLDEDTTDGFICHHGHWSHISQFSTVLKSGSCPISKWDCYLNDSFFSGTVIRLNESEGTYQIGTYIQKG